MEQERRRTPAARVALSAATGLVAVVAVPTLADLGLDRIGAAPAGSLAPQTIAVAGALVLGLVLGAVLCTAPGARRRRARRRTHQGRSDGRRVDPVTGLTHYDPADAGPALGQAEAVVAVEVDNYLMTSQVVGQAAADLLLARAAARVGAAASALGARVRRLHGPHLLVLVPTRAEGLLRELAGRLALLPDATDGPHPAALTVGVAVRPHDGSDVPSLIRAAMVALAHAKRETPGTAVFHAPGMAEEARTRLSVGRALRRAIDTGEITLVYQPQLDLVTGAVVGVEALARWHDVGRGQIPPTTFVRIAEQIGMSAALDRLVFDKALRQLRAWDEAGVQVPRVSLNVSPETLRAPGVPGVLERMLVEHRIAPRRVTVELIESRLLDETAGVAVLRALRQIGVRVSLDDFGTGYASFSQLVTLPIDELKIDRSFLSDSEDPVTSEAVVSAVVRVAETLGLDVVAEGIERVGQQELLRRLRCPVGQGYLYARPLAPDELADWLERPPGLLLPARRLTALG